MVVCATVGARAADCPRKGTLGTSRVLTVDPTTYPRVGLKSFPQTLPLRDHEVVLTFDDGPTPPMTNKVLAALARECVLATFFLVGKPALERQATVRLIAAGGHSIGNHTWMHQSVQHMSFDDAVDAIDKSSAAIEMILHGTTTATASIPFFRFPNFESTPETLDLLQARGVVVFSADLWASDWETMSPQQEFRLLTERLNAARKGIIVLHDPRTWTAAMLPAFLRYLRQHDYHVVHVVPAVPVTAAAEH
jgi:peptidoglycan/xylan/chitin deacetylase (PgdA/CDA1 family)